MSNFFSGNNGNNLFSHVGESSNFFGNNTEQTKTAKEAKEEDNSLDAQYNRLESNYEQIFVEAAESIRRSLDEIKPKDACDNCFNKNCNVEKKDIFGKYPPVGCKLRDWQIQAISYLTNDYRQKLKAEYKAIMDKKNEYECNKCGACCHLAVSEYSYEQLKQRAHRGDKYSQDFISVFIPYETEEEARKINPEYFDLLNRLIEEEKIYYYHCPKVKDNLCTIYDRRPDICKAYPHNPLQLLPSECSFNEWKNSVSHASMLLKAKVDIINFYKENLQ